MFVTQNQFFVFIACIAFGGAVGIIFSVFSCVKFFIKNKVLSAIPDIIAFIFVEINKKRINILQWLLVLCYNNTSLERQYSHGKTVAENRI